MVVFKVDYTQKLESERQCNCCMLNCAKSSSSDFFLFLKEDTDFKGSDCVDDFFFFFFLPWRLTVQHCSHGAVSRASQMTFPVMMRLSGLRDCCLNLYPSLWESSKVVCWAREHLPPRPSSNVAITPGISPMSNLIFLTQFRLLKDKKLMRLTYYYLLDFK